MMTKTNTLHIKSLVNMSKKLPKDVISLPEVGGTYVLSPSLARGDQRHRPFGGLGGFRG